MTLCKRIKTASGSKRHYTFPSGELVVFAGTKKACLFLIGGLSYIVKQVTRLEAAHALRQLKQEHKGVTPDYLIEGEV